MDRERTFDALFRANYAGLCRIATRILPVGQSDEQERLRVQQLLFHHRPHDDDRPAGQVVVLREAVGGGKEGGWHAYDSVPGRPSLSTPESSDA